MKKFIALGIVIFCGSLGSEFISIANSRNSKPTNRYRFEFTGSPGVKIYGATGWVDLKDPNRTFHPKSLVGVLPVTISLDYPSDTVVSASGSTEGQGDVTIRIYRNGVECGKHRSKSTTDLDTKSCIP
jgi:hypothetical protein